jgi:uncharacterized protein (TIGR03435 family)
MAMRRFADRAALVTAMLLAASVFAQSPQPAATFEAADVRAAAPNPSPNNAHGGALRGDRYEIRNITMLGLIGFAYGMDDDHVVGGPSWLEMNRFDIVGLAPPKTPVATLRVMLRTLLADRFKLVVHEDKRQIDTFILTASARTRLRKAASGQANCQATSRPQANGTELKHVVCTNMSMKGLAARLPLPALAADYIPEHLLDLIDDQTGLGGAWDFELDWTPREQLLRAGADAVTLQQALENIGLGFKQGKATVSVLVVDGVNSTPTPNAANVAAKLPPLPPPEFEVASVKPSPPEGTTARARLLPTGQVEFTATPLRQMMNFAWQVPGDEYLVAPDWVESKRFDVIARAWATPVTEAWREGDHLLLMLRQLIVERFKMKYHTENRSVGAFVLTADNPKLKKSDPSTRTRCGGTAATGANVVLTRAITCQNVTMAEFAGLLPTIVSDYLRAPVADMTGLEGRWDFTVGYSPQSMFNQATRGGGDAGAAITPTGVLSIFEAIDQQLGLELQPQKRMLPVMVIDSISEDVDGN